jgi:serine/threonine protein kinase
MLKLVDFGIAKRVSPNRWRALTGPQDSLGSPSYMSPEQMTASRDVDARSDVWALGVVLYELLTGDVPFAGGSLVEIHRRALTEDPRRFSDFNVNVDPELERIVGRCLAKDPAGRYRTADALAHDLESWRARYLCAGAAHSAPPSWRPRGHTWSLSRAAQGKRSRAFLVRFGLGLAACIAYLSFSTGARNTLRALPSQIEHPLLSELAERAREGSLHLLDQWGLWPRLHTDPEIPEVPTVRAYVVEPKGVIVGEGTPDHSLVAERERNVVSIRFP